MFKKESWNPYLAGALAGVVLVLSVLISHHFYGASTTFPRVGSTIGKIFGLDINQFEYFTTKEGKYGPNKLPDWQLLFHFGIFFGALIATFLARNFKIIHVPSKWSEIYGDSKWKRALGAFVGGIILIIGARMAGGCPSGHGLSGVAQLALSGIVALPCFFIGAVFTSSIILKKRGL
ncbi:MAG: YeeE/YedE family protein [Halobacteriovoraceae bacterium]|nr:YeeE/YedE family protein [Halobacteriovoraceae bacterium]